MCRMLMVWMSCIFLLTVVACPREEPTSYEPPAADVDHGLLELAADQQTDSHSDAITDLGGDAASDTAELQLHDGGSAVMILRQADSTATVAAESWVPLQAPEWARQASGLIEAHAGRQVLTASACVRNLPNLALARSSAANRARARLAGSMGSAAERSGPTASPGATLVGVEISDYWVSPVKQSKAGAGQVVCARAILPLAAEP